MNQLNGIFDELMGAAQDSEGTRIAWKGEIGSFGWLRCFVLKYNQDRLLNDAIIPLFVPAQVAQSDVVIVVAPRGVVGVDCYYGKDGFVRLKKDRVVNSTVPGVGDVFAWCLLKGGKFP